MFQEQLLQVAAVVPRPKLDLPSTKLDPILVYCQYHGQVPERRGLH